MGYRFKMQLAITVCILLDLPPVPWSIGHALQSAWAWWWAATKHWQLPGWFHNPNTQNKIMVLSLMTGQQIIGRRSCKQQAEVGWRLIGSAHKSQQPDSTALLRCQYVLLFRQIVESNNWCKFPIQLTFYWRNYRRLNQLHHWLATHRQQIQWLHLSTDCSCGIRSQNQVSLRRRRSTLLWSCAGFFPALSFVWNFDTMEDQIQALSLLKCRKNRKFSASILIQEFLPYRWAWLLQWNCKVYVKFFARLLYFGLPCCLVSLKLLECNKVYEQ